MQSPELKRMGTPLKVFVRIDGGRGEVVKDQRLHQVTNDRK